MEAALGRGRSIHSEPRLRRLAAAFVLKACLKAGQSERGWCRLWHPGQMPSMRKNRVTPTSAPAAFSAGMVKALLNLYLPSELGPVTRLGRDSLCRGGGVE
jgi:hypothetical protein